MEMEMDLEITCEYCKHPYGNHKGIRGCNIIEGGKECDCDGFEQISTAVSVKRIQITCDATIDENHLSYISFTKAGVDRKGIVARTIEAEDMRIMVDIGHDGEVVGIEILGQERVPSILKEHLDE